MKLIPSTILFKQNASSIKATSKLRRNQKLQHKKVTRTTLQSDVNFFLKQGGTIEVIKQEMSENKGYWRRKEHFGTDVVLSSVAVN